jgi:hypothetical protein
MLRQRATTPEDTYLAKSAKSYVITSESETPQALFICREMEMWIRGLRYGDEGTDVPVNIAHAVPKMESLLKLRLTQADKRSIPWPIPTIETQVSVTGEMQTRFDEASKGIQDLLAGDSLWDEQ